MSERAPTPSCFEIDGHVATVTFNQPDRLNAWNWEMGQQLHRHMEAVAGNPDVRAVILRGAGARSAPASTSSPTSAGASSDARPRRRSSTTTSDTGLAPPHARDRGDAAADHRRDARLLPRRGARGRDARRRAHRAEGTQFGCPEARIGVPIDCGLDMRLAAEVGPAGRSGSRSPDAASTPRRPRRSASCRTSSPPISCSRRRAGSPTRSPPTRRSRCRRSDTCSRIAASTRSRFEAMNAAVGFCRRRTDEGFASDARQASAALQAKADHSPGR